MAMEKQLLPCYWEEHLKEKIAQIQTIKKQAGQNCLCVAMITDFHWRENEKYSIPMLERILTECEIPYFFQAGDMISGEGLCPKEKIFGEIAAYQKAFSAIEHKCLCVEGNHDRAYSTFPPPAYYVENIPKSEFDEIYFKTIRQRANAYGEGGYYYVDDDKRKVRYIVLNSHDVPSDEKDSNGYAKYNAMRHYGFLQRQMEWFAFDALNVPSKSWTVIVCSHMSPSAARYENKAYNYQIMTKLLRAFQNGAFYEGSEKHNNPLFDAQISVDYTGKGGAVAAWLGGHIHKDDMSIVDGIVCVDTKTDAAFLSSYPEKRGTINEQAFDVFVFDLGNKTCQIVRIGAGEERAFSYKLP